MTACICCGLRWATDDCGNEYMVIELVLLGSLDQVN